MKSAATVIVACALAACPSAREPEDALDASTDASEERVGRRDSEPPPDAPYEVYVDPGCDAGDPVPIDDPMPCDPYDPGSCADGWACYPGVFYPSGPCGEEVFGTYCAASGGGGQGAHCVAATDCEPGYGCFVTGSGDQCLELCDLSGGEPSCARGRICSATDLRDYGACY